MNVFFAKFSISNDIDLWHCVEVNTVISQNIIVLIVYSCISWGDRFYLMHVSNYTWYEGDNFKEQKTSIKFFYGG